MTHANPESLIDWSSAARVAGRIAPPGPIGSRVELQALVDELRIAAERAWAPAVEFSGLANLIGDEAPIAPVYVVDRAGWAVANSESMARLSAPLLGDLPAQRASAQVLGTVEAAGILALLSTKVLGQFDPYGPSSGRLLLIAPNILDVESVIGAPASDFRQWVCLHELTHAAQFRAAPWLADHLVSLISDLGSKTDPEEDEAPDEPATLGDLAQGKAATAAADAIAGFAAGVVRAGRIVRSGVQAARGKGQAGLMDGFLGPRQQARLAELTAIMALLEGHADVTMDAVGPEVIGSIDQLREDFDNKRDSAKGMAKVFARVFGMEAKLAQYRNGAEFVRGVQHQAGVEALSAAWAAPQNLPRAEEIADPAAWIARVLG
ncbi:zinc-dependent metalloprotease [Rarobacter faecitabidus]|uniref:Putative hydrolase/coenzyme F420 biosynthesis associated uncharacterized protein n=1 Tax=Rarobacter faecitabidus TaxID=13243 RepID=A0A542ZTR6_RARFA|nr:zinc-dependent metalloprotease [Rarobacter faecitabidus]TQL63669.1 putative hydrolase/coenzyme F420 biosynthesis associated uncharacterized protein [Rarobacter faecitabidus]